MVLRMNLKVRDKKNCIVGKPFLFSSSSINKESLHKKLCFSWTNAIQKIIMCTCTFYVMYKDNFCFSSSNCGRNGNAYILNKEGAWLIKKEERELNEWEKENVSKVRSRCDFWKKIEYKMLIMVARWGLYKAWYYIFFKMKRVVFLTNKKEREAVAVRELHDSHK